MSQVWLVTVPNNSNDPQSTFTALQKSVSGGAGHKIYRIELPNLVVGTLDSLMSLSDELSKINIQVEVR